MLPLLLKRNAVEMMFAAKRQAADEQAVLFFSTYNASKSSLGNSIAALITGQPTVHFIHHIGDGDSMVLIDNRR
mgnify:CR=1 FL=1